MPQDRSKQFAEWTKDIRSAIQAGDECDSNTLSFILCPLLDSMKSGVFFLVGQPGSGQGGLLGNLLTVKPLSTSDEITVPGENDEPKSVPNYTLQAWSRIRDVSLGFMILIFIIIIFGNGVGIDAYTVKRAIPRLAMGSLLTFGSFYILQTLIDLSNVLGRAIPTLLWAAAPGGSISNGFSFNLDFNVGGSLVAIALLLILYFLALLAVLVGIAGLIVRQLVIYALVLTAPVAFVAWILPNTEKLFKKWWSNLIKVLMMYPIVTGMLAIATLFQQIVGVDSSQPFSVRLVGIAAPLLALMAIPKTFKMGGDLFAAGAGFVAGRVSKGTDAVKGKAVGAAKGAAGSIPKRIAASDRGQKIAMGLAATPVLGTLGGKSMYRKAAQTRSKRLSDADSLVKDMSSDQLQTIAQRGNFQEQTAAIGALAKMGDRKALLKLSQSRGSAALAYNAASARYAGDFGKNVDLRRIGGSYTDMSTLSDDALSQLSPATLGANMAAGRITTSQIQRLSANDRARGNMSPQALSMVDGYVGSPDEATARQNVSNYMSANDIKGDAPAYANIVIPGTNYSSPAVQRVIGREEKTVERAAPQVGTGSVAYRAGSRVNQARQAPGKAASKVRDFFS